LAAFVFAAGGRAFQAQSGGSSHAVSRATVADHSANLDSPVFVVVVHVPVAATMPILGRVDFLRIQAPSIFRVAKNFVRPPPSDIV